MIIVKLQGGLGNQMFQYAFGRAMALRCGTDCYFESSFFETAPNRHYALDRFQATLKIADKEMMKKFTSPFSRLANRFRPPVRRTVIQEHSIIIDCNDKKLCRDLYFDGYWQSEKYFKDIENIIRGEFKLKNGLGKSAQSFSEEITRTNSVSVHVRRGDYISNAKFAAVHGTLPPDYYDVAIRTISEKSPKQNFFVFSDDIGWVKENITFPTPPTLVSSIGLHEAEEITLMALCKHHIIANSSFSWWGAWLNPSNNKIVIAPKRWFADETKDSTDIVPRAWISM